MLGVEAQTLTVWRQADRYAIPRIVYANKMDRSDASLPLCIKLLKSKFNITPLQLQIPVRGKSYFNLKPILSKIIIREMYNSLFKYTIIYLILITIPYTKLKVFF